MPFPAASLPDELGLEPLLEALFRRLRQVCPDCAADLPDCDELELARRILAAVTDPATGTVPTTDHLTQAATAVADLLATDDPQSLLHRDPRFESPLPARLLIRNARRHTAHKRPEALRVATLAVEAAGRIDVHLWGRDYSRATLIQARCTRVDALRTAGDLAEACREITDLLHLADPRLTLRLRGDIQLLAGQLRRTQGDLEAAAAHLFVARDTYESAQDDPRLARTLLDLAEVYRDHGQIDLAVDAGRRATTLLDPARDRDALLAARHNLAIYLCDAGQPAEAQAELEASRDLCGPAPPPEVPLHSSWIEARIHEQLGNAETAERLYREVQQGFLATHLSTQAVLVSLDLALLLIDQRRYDDSRQVTTWIGLCLRLRRFPRPTLAALFALREALETSQPAPDDLLRCVGALRAALRRSPRS